MKQILEFIKDPSWWFTAFFIAIISSIIAGFAKDYIGSLGSNLSATARERQRRRSENLETFISALENSESYLLLSMTRSIILLVLMALTIILFFVSPMLSESVMAWCDVAPFDPSCSTATPFYLAKLTSIVSVVSFGVLSVLVGYSSTVYFRAVSMGFNRYRRKHGLPSLKF
jgi:hypothetical protein